MSYTFIRTTFFLTSYYQAKEGWWVEEYDNIDCYWTEVANIKCIWFQSNTGYCPNTIHIK